MLSLNQLKNLYLNSPEWLKNIYGKIPFDIRNGSEYRRWKKFLQNNVSIEEYELLKLKETVLYAYENTVYYKELFDSLQISPYDINDCKDFAKLPFIDKDIVRDNYDKLIVNNFPKRKQFYVTTGGSSGTPMKFLQSKNLWPKEIAFIYNYFSNYGFNASLMKASFGGGNFDILKNDEFWKYYPHSNELHFSPFHINDRTINYYVDELNKRKILYFKTYPSSIKLLIEYMKKNNLFLDYQVNTIFLISENIISDDIELIKSFFHCKVGSFYGHSERLIFASSFVEDLSSFEIDRRYGYFELIDDNQFNITSNNIIGEMVGTSFDNYAMPLIRYKTNDKTSFSNVSSYAISGIEGRWKQEYLEGHNGVKVYLTALNMHSDIFKNVIKFQFVQKKIGSATLYLSVKNSFKSDDKQMILHALNKKAGHAVKMNIKIVDTFVLTYRGKFKNIVKEF